MNQSVVRKSPFPFLNVGFLQSRLSWSIRLRWLAAGGFFFATLIAKYFFAISLPFEKIWYFLIVVIGINFVYYGILKIFKEFSLKSELRFLHVHIVIDLLILTVLIHFSGGIDNPIFFFYLFHVVLSSIVFSKRIASAYGTFVVFLFSALIYMEYNDIIAHHDLYPNTLYQNQLYIYILLSVFVITVYVTAYICTTFMQIFRESKRKIDQLNEELIKADQEKTKFFRFTSHELKSPIIAIKSTVDGVLNKYGDSFELKARSLLERASNRAAQMLEIIKELMELSRNRELQHQDQPHYAKVGIKNLLKQVIQQEGAGAEDKEITVNADISDELPDLMGVPSDFEKIFRNIINNAIRYTHHKGSIDIHAYAVSDKFLFMVKDNGIGIPEDEQNKIFDEFFRSENAKKIVTFGTGLGLSLTRQLILKYSGKIELKSRVNEGTTITVSLPIVKWEKDAS